MRHLTIPSAILLVLTAAACEPLAPGGPGSDPGQDPNPDEVPDDGVDEGPGDAGFIECEETITVLDGVDAASPLPFTAVDVLSLVIGERTTDMT